MLFTLLYFLGAMSLFIFESSTPLMPLLLFGGFVLIFAYVLSFSSAVFSFSLFGFITDDLTLLLFYITLLVLFSSWLSFNGGNLLLLSSVFSGLFICAGVVFSSSSFIVLYVCYEASLVPISYAILKWGVYPDRGISATAILLFTSVFTFPLSLVIIISFLDLNSFSFLYYFFGGLSESAGILICLWVFLSFAVNLPLYGLHYWLPLAHVEAPTFGSIVLAGLLLNIGGCGLLRLLPFFPELPIWLSSFFMVYFIFAIFMSSFMCCIQSDFKRLVAYSSVVHMSFICLLFCSVTSLSYNAALILIVFHGLSSPVLFCLVGVLYQLYSTRQFILTRGLLTVSPLCAFISTSIFLLSVPVPPSPGFLSEVLLFTSVFSLSSWVVLLLLVSLLISVIYNLLWYSSTSFSSCSPSDVLAPASPLSLAVIFALSSSSFIFIGFIWLF